MKKIKRLYINALELSKEASYARGTFEMALMEKYDLDREDLTELDTLVDAYQDFITEFEMIEEEIKTLKKRQQ